MNLDGISLTEIAQVLGVGAAVGFVLAACAVVAVKTLRSDRRIDQLVETMQQALDAKEQEIADRERERDYWKQLAEQDRDDMERRFDRRLETARRESEAGRARLYGHIEELRAQLHAYVLKGRP